MKFIKTYEGKIVKKTDSRILDHPLLSLADAIENMLKTLAKLQNTENYPIGKTKKYFLEGYYDPISIKISYDSYNKNNIIISKLFTFTLSSNKNDTYSISMDASTHSDPSKSKIFEIKTRLYDFMRKYVSRSNYLYAGGKNEFTLNDMNDLIQEFKKITSELEVDISSNKYNI